MAQKNCTCEKINSEGRLTLKVIRDGKEVKEERKNLIVTGGRHALARLLGGSTDCPISHIAIGEGSASPAPEDNSLTNAVSVPVTEVRIGTGLENDEGGLFDDPGVVQFHFRFGKDKGAGTGIMEYGLFCKDGTLFSRVAREAVFNKTSIDVIVGFWQIRF